MLQFTGLYLITFYVGRKELVETMMNLKQNDTSGMQFNAALKDLIKVTGKVAEWETRATSNDGSLIVDLCFLHRCRVIKSELDSLLRKLPNRKDFKAEDKEICKMLGFQIGRLKIHSSVESRDFDSRHGPDFRVEAADSSMADFTSNLYDHTWERLHLKYPGCAEKE
ncbi:uncharacterized protein N7477_009360 [Penicillium maclennaniae]|uniref:uncharacterized protein n=1 Tax=Penicillium maclennaniae TaxID=1343394 RepID=UPI00254100F2|nr:uncharacterized protein N7477_009360 [Penicillium maclennaniae]KAJ5661744.1 hypothetical protein N7477_009360 [Penicillium maclennaniae]